MSPEATEPHRAGSPQQFAAFLWEIPGTVRNRLETVPGTVGIHTGTVGTVDILLKEYKPFNPSNNINGFYGSCANTNSFWNGF